MSKVTTFSFAAIEIAAEFARFIEFQDGGDGRYVTSASCLLFAERIAEPQRAQSQKAVMAQDVYPAIKLRIVDAVGQP